MARLILHIDMDAFYASVEQADHPELKGKPVIVGGISNRGVVSAASYEARKYGIHSAMPIFQAKRNCPHGLFVRVRMARYIEVSQQIMAILDKYSPIIEQVSVDEAYMDISGLEKLHGGPEVIARKIKEEILKHTSLTCSVGIAPNKLLAKIASEMNKPDGLTFIDSERASEVLKTLPIEKVPGVGEKMRMKLKSRGISRLGDFIRLPEGKVFSEMGKFGVKLREFALGMDDSPVVVFSQAKSISSEETFDKDIDDPEALKKRILEQAESVGKKLREKQIKGSTITLKLKRSDFTQVARSMTLGEPTQSTDVIYRWCLKLLEEMDIHHKFRLVGVGVSGFAPAKGSQEQLGLFQEKAHKKKSWEDAEKAMDAIKDKFGHDAIKRGPLVT
jgi:DNA polymerase-4